MADNLADDDVTSPSHPSPPSRLTQLRKAEPWFTTKFCFRLALCIFNVVAIGCTAWIIAYNSRSSDLYESYYNQPRSDVIKGLSQNLYLAILDYDYDNFPWSDYIQLPKGILVVLCISVGWCIVAMRIPFVLKPTQRVHPGLAVACDLILWLAFLVIGLFTVMTLWSLTRFGANPSYLPNRYMTYRYSSFGYDNSDTGYYYLASNGTWVYNFTTTSSTYSNPTTTDNSTGYTSDYNTGYYDGTRVGYEIANQEGYAAGYNSFVNDNSYNSDYQYEHDYGSHNASSPDGNSSYNKGWRDGYDYGWSDEYPNSYEEGSNAAANDLSSGNSTLISTRTSTTTTTYAFSSSTGIVKRSIITTSTEAIPTGQNIELVNNHNPPTHPPPPPTTTKPELAKRSVKARQFLTGASPTATVTSTSTNNNTRSCSDSFTSCAEQDNLINQMWRAKPKFVAIVAVINAIQWLNLIIHFILFVWSCYDTSILNNQRKDKRRTQIAEILFSDLEKRGLVLTVDGKRALAQGSYVPLGDFTATTTTGPTEPVNHGQTGTRIQSETRSGPETETKTHDHQSESARAGPSSQPGWPLPAIKEI